MTSRPAKEPVEDGETDDDSKVVASAKIDVAAGIGDSIKPDTDQKPAAEQKTDTANVAPTNLSAPTITTAEATAIVPAPAQAPSAAPDDGEQAGQESLQQVALVADTTPQIRQLDPALPKAVAGKKVEDGKQADNSDQVESDQPANQTEDTFQLLASDASQPNTENKPIAAVDETDKHISQARGEIPENAHCPDAKGPMAPGTDISTAVGKGPPDTLSQLPIPSTAPHASQNAAAPATLVSQPGPQPAAVPLSGVAIEIAGKAVAGKNRFEIRLDPPKLGRIEVRLDVDRDGNVTSRMTVDRPDTLNLLRRDAAGLERALQDAGLKTANNGLQFSLRDQSMNEQQASAALDTAQIVVNDETLPSVDVIPQRYGRLAGQGSGLDIRV